MGALYGILGGMGPLAGVDLFRRIVELTRADFDQQHIPILLYSASQVPDRSAAILGRGKSSFPAITDALNVLVLAGVSEIAMACNTAHYWYESLQNVSSVKILHIVDAVICGIQTAHLAGTRFGILATEGTVRGRVYADRMRAAGIELDEPTTFEIDELIGPGIRAVKAGDLVRAKELFSQAVARQLDRGVDKIILGCTEVGIVLTGNRDLLFIDSTEALARFCVERWHFRPPVSDFF